ncbi:hypothetical protein LR48_Vigan492s001700 [Vigna angularis]|uniref:Uncharacterized protein n=1 Tax=Phaseolus angularis TaxID=3914 RepID=A0A0L9TBX9_PHAAN|nr:hypothetical protein LR48_Vigan492s001700 [Vigna angularis]
MKQKSDSRLSLSEGGDPPPPPSPPSWHEKWKIRWLSRALKIGQEGSATPKKTHLSEDDSLGALDELANIISDVPMNVHWDSTTFGREAQIPLYLHQQDVSELVSGREEINITLIQVWMMCQWQLLVLSILEKTIVWFCSLYKSPPSPLRHVVDCSLATHMMLSGRSTARAKKLGWVALKKFNRTAPILEKSLQLVRKTCLNM